MIQYPLSFQAEATTRSGVNENWNIRSGDQQAVCAIPPEFEGPGGGFSPEDLFAQALTNCFVATFKVFAQASRMEFEEVTAKAELIVDLSESRKPVMKKLILHATIRGASSNEKAQLLAKKAFQSGFILNSVKTELEFDLQVS